jgi:hypothetical protein
MNIISMSYRYLTANIPNASTNNIVNVNWDISANNLDASLNLRTINIAPSGPNPARNDVSYNFSVIHLAGNTINRSTYIPNPYNGKMSFTTSNSYFSVWNAQSSLWWNFSTNLTSGYIVTASAGSAYVPSPVYLAADGTTIISAPASGGSTIIAFTSVASVTTYTFTPLFTGSIKYIIVAGGGGGGEGGGGAGGLLQSSSYAVTSGTGYSISVGAGGSGCTSSAPPISPQTQVQGTNGGNSVFNGITAIGGGAGGCQASNPVVPGPGCGNSGGSGGGCRRDANAAAYPAYASGNPAVNTGTSGQGYAGGNTQGNATYTGGGGGGGAGGVGGYGLAGGFSSSVTGTLATEQGGAGGVGLDCTSIIPVTAASALNVGQIYTPPPIGPVLPPAVYFAGGGGGSCEQPGSVAGGAGGTGGGGAGAKGSFINNSNPPPYIPPNPLPTPGTANTGGGGGGVAAVNSDGYSAGNGGSGVIIIRFTN